MKESGGGRQSQLVDGDFAVIVLNHSKGHYTKRDTIGSCILTLNVVLYGNYQITRNDSSRYTGVNILKYGRILVNLAIK